MCDIDVGTMNTFIYGNGKTLSFDGIKYYVVNGRGVDNKFILKDISGMFKFGQLSAIMGPSGAGKSSLMNILAGYCSKNVLGSIYVNQEARNFNEFRKMSCYIMQEDLLLPHLTVEEAMNCSANLKLNKKTTSAMKRKIIDDILTSLSLTDVIHVRTLKLSGGQKKRLAIAQELVNNPPVMFFDEPTSGLDSASCYQCIALLRRLAREGRTIICTIHQPSAKIFEMFDYLYFLADGHCIYRGPVSCLVPYLATQELICPAYHNPADYFMEVACGEHGDNLMRLVRSICRKILDETVPKLEATQQDMIEQNLKLEVRQNEVSVSSTAEESFIKNSFIPPKPPDYELSSFTLNKNVSDLLSSINPNSEYPKNSITERPSLTNVIKMPLSTATSSTNSEKGLSYETSLGTQFCVLFVRSFRSIMRDATLTHLRFISHVVVGILIGLLYYRIGNNGNEVISNSAFLFFNLLFVMFASLMPTVMTFPLEMPIFVREHMNYWYSLKAYYLAKSFADVPFQICFPVIYGSIVYWMTEQPADMLRFCLFLFISVQTSLVGQSLGLVIGAATSLEDSDANKYVSIYLGPATGIPMLLFSGFFLSLDMIPKYLQWLSYISFTRYAFSGTGKVIYGLNRTELNCESNPRSRMSIPCIKKPTSILDLLNIDHYNLSIDCFILCVFFIVLRVLGYFILRWRIKGQR